MDGGLSISGHGMASAGDETPMRSATIVNPEGLHARPCHAVVSLTLGFDAELRIRNGGVEVNGRSILELMTLSAVQGDLLELRASGADAEAMLHALCELIAAGFVEND